MKLLSEIIRHTLDPGSKFHRHLAQFSTLHTYYATKAEINPEHYENVNNTMDFICEHMKDKPYDEKKICILYLCKHNNCDIHDVFMDNRLNTGVDIEVIINDHINI